MVYLDGFLRLLLVFPVVGVANLYACQAAVSNVFPQNAEQNFTRSPVRLLITRQEHPFWESPPSTFPVSHQPLHNAIGAGAGSLQNLEAFQPVSSASLQKKAALLLSQQQQRSLNNRVADSISYSVLRFALEVGNQVSENAYFSKSEVFSPLSIMSMLSLLLAGAKGKSYQQLNPIFGFNLDAEPQRDPNYAQLMHIEFGNLLQDIEKQDLKTLHYFNNVKWRDTPAHYNVRVSSQKPSEPLQHIIKVANGLFAQIGYNLNPNYRDVITTIYRSELAQLDYRNNNEAARQHINNWVSKNTYGKIPNIIQNPIPQTTNLILASVLYFKAFWENTFFEAATALDNFYPEGENKPAVKVQMMATGGLFPYYDSPDFNCRIIGLPYKGNLTSMYVIQPKNSSRAVLKDFQSKISAQTIDDMISKMAYRTAIVAFPKIHVARQLNMKDILRKFGVTDIFSNAESDLSLIGGLAPQNINQNTPLINRARPMHATYDYASRPELMDRFHEKPLLFASRFGDITNITATNTTDDASTANKPSDTTAETTTEKIVDETTMSLPLKEDQESVSREKRQALSNTSPISLLEAERLVSSSVKSDLYVEDILHKVDFEVNEQGTEAAAATLTYLRRSGTDITFRADSPFILLIRHDPSKLILFYGIINEPES